MTLFGAEIGIIEQRARTGARTILQQGAVITAFLMVLPGLLSSRPVENAALGLAVGLGASAALAMGCYLWRSYVEPYRRVRETIETERLAPPVLDIAA